MGGKEVVEWLHDHTSTMTSVVADDGNKLAGSIHDGTAALTGRKRGGDAAAPWNSALGEEQFLMPSS